jgi:hypothetical protein
MVPVLSNENTLNCIQCCGSGMLYPGSDHCSIPDPGGKKAPDPTYFCIKAINKFC